MPHVITQSCCSDGSCVYACPVNCIHPSPDEPGFATAEMLHIDPEACVDCGACVSACPVGAITTESKLTTAQLPFIEINALYYPKRPDGEKLPPTSKLAPVIEAPMITRPGAGPLRVAIVGSGPAAMYAADELLTQPGVCVNVFEKLPTPYGLVRAGVAPDHQITKRVTELFDRMAQHRGFEFYLNVEVGQDISHDELLRHHHAVLYAVGASSDRPLQIDGFGMPGTATATEVVAWINSHPEYADLSVPLDRERVVIVGNGNVALDVARVLTADPDRLAATDISRGALSALRDSKVREVVIAARRGPSHSAFTLPEMIGLTAASRVVLSAADHERVRADLAAGADQLTRHKLELLASLDVYDERDEPPTIRMAYHLTPLRVLGDHRTEGIEFAMTGTDEVSVVEAGLVLSSIGYHGRPVVGLPFDAHAGVVPNREGQVIDPQTDRPVPGSYVAGWIKRGPTGFIGTNKSCAQQTVNGLVNDYNAGRLADPEASDGELKRLVRQRQPSVIDGAGWQAIDAAEIARGAVHSRPRDKFTSIPAMLDAAAAGRPPRRGLLGGLLR
jgi:ferredoxin--NADP+ reductase